MGGGGEGGRRDYECGPPSQEMLVSEDRCQHQPGTQPHLSQEVASATPFPFSQTRAPRHLRWAQILSHFSVLSPGPPSSGGSADVYSGEVCTFISASAAFACLSGLWLLHPCVVLLCDLFPLPA